MTAPTSEIADRIVVDLTTECVAARAQLQAALPPGGLLPEDDLPDLSPAGQKRTTDAVRRARALLAEAADDDPTTVAVLDTFLALGDPGGLPGTDGAGFEPYFHDVFGYGKPLLEYDELLTSMPITSRREAESYLARLNGCGEYVDGILAGVDERADLGLASTEESISRTVAQLDARCSQPPGESALVAHLATRLAAAGLDAGDLVDRATGLVETRVHASWARLAERGRALLPTAREPLGLCALPGGDAAYRYAVRAGTTTDLTPEQIHQRGLDEVERLHDVIRNAFHSLGLRGSDVGDLYRELAARDDQKYPAGDRDAVVHDVAAVVRDIGPALKPFFTDWPTTPCPVEVVAPALEPVMPSHVRPPRVAGQPFTFGLNVADALAGTRSETHVLTWHEALPGHALQMALASQRRDLPGIRRVLMFNAYSEGWAKYAETLPLSLGVQNDPFLELARLRYELFSTSNLVADTGCNLLGWDVERVRTYCSWATGDDTRQPRMIPLRSLHTPGQLLGYKVGMLAFEDALTAAQKLWGTGFTFPRFHDAVLNGGSLPLSMLQQAVARG
ncbi:MAG: DUF885 domain-containing protein [Frankiaceae bacterium]|nr:DUF885 domain-containing protein [Frankiaceae bacterium]